LERGHPDQEDETEVEVTFRKYDATVESSMAVPTTALMIDEGSGKELSSCTPPQNHNALPELEAAQLESGDGTAFVAETEMKAGDHGSDRNR
jgi:hypothetical protein